MASRSRPRSDAWSSAPARTERSESAPISAEGRKANRTRRHIAGRPGPEPRPSWRRRPPRTARGSWLRPVAGVDRSRLESQSPARGDGHQRYGVLRRAPDRSRRQTSLGRRARQFSRRGPAACDGAQPDRASMPTGECPTSIGRAAQPSSGIPSIDSASEQRPSQPQNTRENLPIRSFPLES